jgi:hypothetical protein
MSVPNQEQRTLLTKSGWIRDRGDWRTCRVCHKSMAARTPCWSSPNYSAYHDYCVLHSPLAIKHMNVARKMRKRAGRNSNIAP